MTIDRKHIFYLEDEVLILWQNAEILRDNYKVTQAINVKDSIDIINGFVEKQEMVN